jgi:hypothetical protein
MIDFMYEHFCKFSNHLKITKRGKCDFSYLQSVNIYTEIDLIVNNRVEIRLLMIILAIFCINCAKRPLDSE